MIIPDRGEAVAMDFIMRDRIENTISGVSKAELCAVADEALALLDIL